MKLSTEAARGEWGNALGNRFRGGLGHQHMAACNGADHQHAAGLEQLATNLSWA